MPENPVVKARRDLVSRLRAHAQIESEGHSIDLNQAANEIESLAQNQDSRDDEAFRKTFSKFADTAKAVSDMANDGFKAPEQTMEMLPVLFNDAWHLQIAWELVRRGR